MSKIAAALPGRAGSQARRAKGPEELVAQPEQEMARLRLGAFGMTRGKWP